MKLGWEATGSGVMCEGSPYTNGIEIKKKKVDRVLSWLGLKNIKDIRKFLDFANYYKMFIKDFVQVAMPMNVLTRKDVKW